MLPDDAGPDSHVLPPAVYSARDAHNGPRALLRPGRQTPPQTKAHGGARRINPRLHLVRRVRQDPRRTDHPRLVPTLTPDDLLGLRIDIVDK